MSIPPTNELEEVIETAVELANALRSKTNGIFTIKPKVLFSKIEFAFPEPTDMKLQVPSSGIGSITLLEASALVSLLRLTSPKRIFEFGTFLGYSTALFVRNAPNQSAVYSIDLGDEVDQYTDAGSYSRQDLVTDDEKNDNYLRYVQGTRGPHYLRTLSEVEEERLHLLHGDSRKLDTAANALEGTVDFVFVDGGHDMETIVSDTRKAEEMIGKSGVIVWHDFASGIHSDVTDFLKTYANTHVVLHVQHTMLAFALFGSCCDDFLVVGSSEQ
tara:strand:+ start:833 stop:1648 length:816 start_codon:yes stop_codon:yes gene_type:complete